MALIYTIKCESCSFVRTFPDRAFIAVDPSGAEKVCYHPGAMEEAEKLAGVPLSDLLNSKRAYAVAPAFCPRCGVVGFYKTRGINIHNPKRRQLWLDSLVCSSCQHKGQLPATSSIEPFGGGCTLGLLLNLALFSGIIWGIGWSLPGFIAFVGGLIISKQRTRTERKRWADTKCPDCGHKGMTVRIVRRNNAYG